jgi:hypothetical protein
MKRWSIGATFLFLTATLPAAPALEPAAMPLDLQPVANQKLDDTFNESIPGNDLAELPRGKQKFAGVPFHIGEKLILLGSRSMPEKPEKMEGVKVKRTFDKLHILHGTGYSDPDDTVIARYVVHYADDTTEKVEIAYGKDVRDWWAGVDAGKVSRGTLAWEGSNAAAKRSDSKLHLYLATWKNPKPEQKVESIDVVSSQGGAAPFCLALTVE